MTRLFLFITLIVAYSSCKDDSEQVDRDRQAEQQEDISQYLADKGLTSLKTSSGLHHIVVQEGEGSSTPELSSNVEVKYRGSLLNGQIFDQSPENKTITFGLEQVILGWQEGIQLMKLNGKSILIIPSHLGYGGQSIPGIPAHSVLIFDVELVGFN